MFIYEHQAQWMLAPATSANPGMYTWRLQQRSLQNFNNIKKMTYQKFNFNKKSFFCENRCFLNKLMFIYEHLALRMLAPATSAIPGMYTWRLQQRSLRNFNSIKFLTAACRHARCAARGAAQTCARTHARTCVRRCALKSPGAVQELIITAKDILSQL